MEGVLYDFSCGLDPYLLNRDPKDFEYKRTLVDGAHWASQKKLKRPNQTGKGVILVVVTATTTTFIDPTLTLTLI